MSRFRMLFTALVALALALALAACGDDDDGGNGASGQDPREVLDRTFSDDHESVDSGNLALTINVEATGDQPGTLDAELSGPFENQGEAEVPKFDFRAEATVTGGEDDFDFDGSLTSTGDAAYIGYQGTDYEVDQALFDRFRQSVEAGDAQQGQNDEQTQQILDALGLEDPGSLLTNLQNEGAEDVGGAETTHISGDLDVERSVEALQSLLRNASALGALGGSSSQVPSPEELEQVKDAITEARFDVYSGTDDYLLRRLGVQLTIEPPDESGSVDLSFDFSVSDVNEPQTIEAPANPRSFGEFLGAVGVDPSALGALGALGSGGALGGGTEGGEGTTPALPGASGEDAQAAREYLNCIAQAESAADLEGCEDLQPTP